MCRGFKSLLRYQFKSQLAQWVGWLFLFGELVGLRSILVPCADLCAGSDYGMQILDPQEGIGSFCHGDRLMAQPLADAVQVHAVVL